MTEIGGLVIELDASSVIAGLLSILLCLVSAPLVVGHWRGTSSRIDEGKEHLPLTEASRMRLAAVLPVNQVGLLGAAVGVFANALRPPVPAVAAGGMAVFFVCALLWVSVWLWGQPQLVVPRRYRTEDWPGRD